MLVWRLRGDPHGDLADAGLVLDHEAAGLDRHGGVGLLVDGLLDHVHGGREDLVEHRGRSAVVVDDVGAVRLVDELVGVDGGQVVDHRWQGVDVDHDEARVLGDVAIVGDDERDRVADEPHLTLGQGRPWRLGPAGPSCECHCSWTPGLRSSATNTAWTPGSASASDTSMPTIRPLAT